MVQIRSVLPALAGLVLFLGLSTLAWAAADELVQQAQEKLRAGNAEQAYELLAAEEAEYAGHTEFDYWLGLAAVRAGEHGHATFALERVIASNPNHAGARLELAAAYVALDQNGEAARQLDELRTLDPPPKAAQRIEQLSEAVGRRTKREARQDKLFYVSIESGHDDNVATYPDDFTIFPGLPPVTTLDSFFYGARMGGSRNFALGGGQKIGVSGQLYTRNHTLVTAGQEDAEPFDQDFGLVRLRWMNDVNGRQEVEAGLEGSQFRLDGEKYYNLMGVYGIWRLRSSDRLTWELDLRVRDIAFDAEVNDYTYYSLKPGIRYQLSPRWRIDANLAFELESANEDRLGGDAQLFGLHTKSRYALNSRNILEAGAQYDRARYQDTFSPFSAINNPQSEDRDDDRFDLTLGWDWFPNEDWRTRLEARYRKQDSSLDLYSYERTLGKLSVTRFF
jgi:hypothetical protein